MPNYSKIAAPLAELLSKMPAGSRAAQEAIAAEMAARKAAQEAAYAPHTLPTEKGKKTIAKAKKTLGKEDEAVQAPSVIIPSKVSNVEQAIRQSKGEYGAKRVQRAADQVKNLENQYTEEALRQAFGGDNAAAMMVANPAEFQKYAATLTDPYRAAIESYMQKMSPGGGGASDVPFLELNKNKGKLPFVSGHEGRHRNVALEELGDENTLWRMLPRANLREPFPRRSQEDYLQALIEQIGDEPLVIPEERFTNKEDRIPDWTKARKLPPLFAEGGSVEGGAANMPNFFNTDVNFGNQTSNSPPPPSAEMLGQIAKTINKAKGGVIDLDEIVHSAMQRGVQKMGVGGAAKKAMKAMKALTHSGDNALPLVLPRANMSSDFINAQAERVARQMLGEHVLTGKAKDTKNLAGRSMKEQERVKKLNYKLTPYGTVAQESTYSPTKGDIIVSFPGDQTVSNKILDELEGFPIDSEQQGGALYGLGQKHLPEPEFWKSTEVPAKNVQSKVDRLADAYEPNRIIGSHLAMGPMSNNFAMHFADANLRAIDWSKADPAKINMFDSIIAKGYKDPKTKEIITFPHWPGVADREAAMEVMKSDTALRKWFNNRMKVPKVTQPLGLPNGLDIQYAITEPFLRDMEINMTGLMTGELKPGALVEAAGNPHNTYSHRILGDAIGQQEVLTPFVISNPDAAQHIATTKDPSDFTGTIQKVFPHQLVDDQYINQFNEYRERIKQLTGKKKGGLAEGGIPEKRDVSQLFPLKWSADANLQKGRTGVWTDTNDVFTGAMSGLFNMLAGGLRGRVIGTAGIPGDIIEGMSDLEGALPAMERKPKGQTFPQTYKTPPAFKLPTMEDLDTILPSAGDSHEAKIAQELGQFMPLTGEELAPAGRALVASAKKLAPTAAEMALDIASKYGVDPRMNIIKPKGGNFLNNSSEFVPRRLKNETTIWNQDLIDKQNESLLRDGWLPELLPKLTPNQTTDLAVGKWIDKKLHPYIKNEMGTAEDPIRLGIERRAAEAEKLKEANQARLAKMEADIAKAKAAGKDTTLSEGDLEKAREKFADEEYIASQGLFHVTIPEHGWADYTEGSKGFGEGLRGKRERAGVQGEPLGTHPASKKWERAVDAEVKTQKVKQKLSDPDTLERNPWLTKLNPDDVVYDLDSYSDVSFEFRHMIDELKEAMDPASVLPKHLKITPKDLEKMTVDDVSALSGKISAWRNVQKTKSDLQVANNPATHTFKEYPENNPNGVSWRQIKRPEGYSDEEAEKFVRQATKYEGDMMRHCVGGAGHCEPLLNGEVEIYTLRDAKGEPHVTIEVEPNKYAPRHEEVQKYMALAEEEAKRLPNGYTSKDIEDIAINMAKKAMPSKILEIKGKNNRKPNPEYIPFVQDFVKSGNFSSVGDMHHTDLYDVAHHSLKDFIPQSFDASSSDRMIAIAAARRAGELKNGLMTREEWEPIVKKYLPQNKAQGGAVNMAESGVINLDDLVAQALSKNVTVNLDDMVHQALTKRFAKGGAAYNAI